MREVQEVRKEVRVLYVPKDISWDEQYNRAVKLLKLGYTVELHEHSFNESCPVDTPNGRTVRCGELTEQEGAVKLVLASEHSET